ncbi:MAG: 50S ribosomal protein L32 [Candidatus Hydrogenedentales bacterium]
MPVPKRRTGKTRRNTRRAHHALKPPCLTECQNCGERIVPHRVCPKCGYYHTRTVINVEEG